MDARTLQRELAALHTASFGWALACSGRERQMASDVLQDAYCKVLDGRARFDARASLKTWLFGVIRMTAREHRRWRVLRVLRRAGEEDSAAGVADEQRAPDSEVAHRERAEQVARALARLPDRQREVLHLVFYEEMSIAEAAEVMKVAIGTARQHYERGKRAMAALLQRGGTDR